MNLSSNINTMAKWTLVGPMGPDVPHELEINPVIAVDGGALFTKKIDHWIGDADSFKGELKNIKATPLPKEKSKSDLGHALELVAHFPWLDLHLWGFLGGRRDHEMINFGEVLLFSQDKEHLLASFYGPRGEIEAQICSRGEWIFEHSGVFSIISIEEQAMKIQGKCKYKIEKLTQIKPFSSQTLSNESDGKFEVFGEKSFIILFTHEQK